MDVCFLCRFYVTTFWVMFFLCIITELVWSECVFTLHFCLKTLFLSLLLWKNTIIWDAGFEDVLWATSISPYLARLAKLQTIIFVSSSLEIGILKISNIQVECIYCKGKWLTWWRRGVEGLRVGGNWVFGLNFHKWQSGKHFPKNNLLWIVWNQIWV